MPGRALPAAQPHTEFTTIISVPAVPVTAASTSSADRSSRTPRLRELFPHRGDEHFWIRHKTPSRSCLPLLDEGALLKLGDRLPELLLRVHDDRSVPRHRLFDRLAGHEQEPDALVAGLHRHFIAVVENDE